jgi:endonuclease/exonuclease/phosphatase family metal-dependent hydrolase
LYILCEAKIVILKEEVMAKIVSFASWNVEHFKGKDDRIERVVSLLKDVNPDLFAIYEVEGKQVFNKLMSQMSTHSFFITEKTDKANMEILIGFRKSLSVFVTQRDEFRSKVPTLRPGTLATVRKGDEDYGFLFLHLKSFPDPRSWGLRDDMFRNVASLKRKLDKSPNANPTANLIVLGDFNTMGLSAPYNNISDLTPDHEIAFLEKRFKKVSLRRLPKTAEISWWNGSDNYAPGSKLDHVFADENLNFKTFDDGAEIKVIGWPEFSVEQERLNWINQFSDHALLYGELHS